MLCAHHQENLTPIFGPAESIADGRGLVFHPQNHLSSLPRKEAVDWMDHLDGIRLNWNEDPLLSAEY